MRTSRFTDEQIVGILKEHAAGGGTAAVCRRHRISEQTLDRWKRADDGLEGNELKRLKALEEENARRKAGGGGLGGAMLRLLGKARPLPGRRRALDGALPPAETWGRRAEAPPVA